MRSSRGLRSLRGPTRLAEAVGVFVCVEVFDGDREDEADTVLVAVRDGAGMKVPTPPPPLPPPPPCAIAGEKVTVVLKEAEAGSEGVREREWDKDMLGL